MVKAIITLYYPSQKNIENVINISKQVDMTIVCDNSPTECTQLKENGKENIRYVWFGRNLGLSAAFNNVLKDSAYFVNDEEYVIFFDQDSSVSSGHIKKLVDEFETIKLLDTNIGALGPVFFNTSNNTIEKPRMNIPINENSFRVKSIITSSMVTTFGILNQVGFWNEKIFLDMADWDLCWRMMEKGKNCYMTDKVVLKHSLGNGEKKIGPLRVREGSPFREYYQTRDCLYLLQEKYVPLKFKIRFVAMLTIRPILHVIALSDKKKRVQYILRGIKDFKGNIHGELVN